MDLRTALQKLEELLTLIDEVLACQTNKQTLGREKKDRLTALYGEVEEVIHQFEGVQAIKLDNIFGGSSAVYKDWVAAGYLSGRIFHHHEGRTQLVKVIGKVRAKLEAPGTIEAPTSLGQLLRALRRFRECCQFIENPPANERRVQDIIWIMLRAQFDRLDREGTLPKFGLKSYKPDFGIPDLRTLLEVKYIGLKTDPTAIQEEALADAPPYLKSNPAYAGMVVFVYDAAQKLLDSRKFVEDLRRIDGIVDVIVVPGVGKPQE